MMLRRLLPLGVVLAFAPAAYADPASDVATAIENAPHRLHIDATCLSNITIAARNDFSSTADMEDVPEGISFHSNDRDAWLSGADCHGDAIIYAHPGAALIISPSGADINISGLVNSPISLTTGNGNVTIDRVGSLLLRALGAGDVSIGTLFQRGFIFNNGSGDITLGTVATADLMALLNGKGDITIGGGFVGHMLVQNNDAGNFVMRGVAGTATVITHGKGHIALERVTGLLHKHTDGGGVVSVRYAPPAQDDDVGQEIQSENNGIVIFSNGTQITSQGVTNPDGSVINFDALGTPAASSNFAAPSATPASPAPQSPSDTEHSPARQQKSHGYLSVLLFLVALLLLRRLIMPFALRWMEKHRPDWAEKWRPFLMPSGAWQNRNAKPPASDPGLVELTQCLQRLEPRLAQLEGYMTSSAFQLRRKSRGSDRSRT
ncbi:hypothetical protein ABUE34_06960 [Kozakia baliensis]|uniref:hypothetical protein n=1 Tax=Kozakia baliensis TaxID=153496 RepID=UPI00345BE37C